MRHRADLPPLSLQLTAGEALCLVGPNGVGKTTWLRVMAGLVAHAEGLVSRAGRVGYCPQDYRESLLPWATAGANIALNLRSARDDGARREAVGAAAEVVGLRASELDARPGTLSGGVQQRVALARALAAAPPLLLLDEPFSALDPASRSALRERLRAALVRLEMACVFVTHDPDDVVGLATRGLHLPGSDAPPTFGPPDDDFLRAMRAAPA